MHTKTEKQDIFFKPIPLCRLTHELELAQNLKETDHEGRKTSHCSCTDVTRYPIAIASSSPCQQHRNSSSSPVLIQVRSRAAPCSRRLAIVLPGCSFPVGAIKRGASGQTVCACDDISASCSVIHYDSKLMDGVKAESCCTPFHFWSETRVRDTGRSHSRNRLCLTSTVRVRHLFRFDSPRGRHFHMYLLPVSLFSHSLGVKS